MFLKFLSFIFLDSAFPVIFALVPFAILNYKQVPLNSIFRFILTFFLVTLLFRVVGYPVYVNVVYKPGCLVYNARYLYTLTFSFIILAAIGFPKMVEVLQKYIFKKVPSITMTHIKILLILIIGVSCIGKALSCPDKNYIKEITQIIRKSNKNAILILDITTDITRIKYHAGVVSCSLASISDKDFKNLGHSLSIINSKGTKPFVLVENSDKNFRELFKSGKVKFPLKLIKEFKEKRTCFSLYEYDVNYQNQLTN